MLKSDSSYMWRLVESRTFSNAATGIANPPSAARRSVAGGQNPPPRESISRLAAIPGGMARSMTAFTARSASNPYSSLDTDVFTATQAPE